MSAYRLAGSQIISPLGTVVADVHGLATKAGQRNAQAMLAALNCTERRAETLRGLRADAREIADGPGDHSVRRLAGVMVEVIEQLVAP